MSRTTEVCYDISSGVLTALPVTVYKATAISEECITADQPITKGNIQYVTVSDAGGIGYNDAVVKGSLVTNFLYIGAYDRIPNFITPDISAQFGQFVHIELYQSGTLTGSVYFDIANIDGVNEPCDVTFRILSENYEQLYSVVYATPGVAGSALLLLTTAGALYKEFKIRLDQSFSNLKRSYRTIQNEKTFKSNDDYLRKLKTFKTRKNPCQ